MFFNLTQPSMQKPIIYICVAMLFIAALPVPVYGYYVLLKIVVTTVFGYAAYITFSKGKNILPWLFGLVAVAFNPVIPVHLSKEAWVVIDIAAGIFLLVSSGRISGTKE